MAKVTDGRPIALTVRKAIGWRIPIDILDRIDKVRAQSGQDRTAVVVEALSLYLDRVERVGRVRRAAVARPKKRTAWAKAKRAMGPRGRAAVEAAEAGAVELAREQP